MTHFRAIFISDLHLGTHGCRAAELIEFLEETHCQTLYLVGDVLDFWAISRKSYFPRSHQNVISTLLDIASKGTEVFYLPGNHDEVLRQFVPMKFGSIQVVDSAIHVTGDGRSLLVIHGDQFDQVMVSAPWLAWIGDIGYSMLLRSNNSVNWARSRFGLPYWSLSAYVKHRVKRAVQFMSDYQHRVLEFTRATGTCGVICGHIHHPELWEKDGLTYGNTGDWVESMTAVVEDLDGTLRLIDWSKDKAALTKTELGSVVVALNVAA